MLKKFSLTVVLLGAPALAAEGGLVFEKACARCHQISTPASAAGKQGRTGPDLGPIAQAWPGPKLRAWIKRPQLVKPESNCDTRGVAPNQVSDLLQHLYTVSKPLPMPDKQRRELALEKALEGRSGTRPSSKKEK